MGFSFLFDLLEQGPAFYQPSLLQIIANLLQVHVDLCVENPVFKNKIPQWFGTVAKFLYGPYASDALQIVNACLVKQDTA